MHPPHPGCAPTGPCRTATGRGVGCGRNRCGRSRGASRCWCWVGAEVKAVLALAALAVWVAIPALLWGRVVGRVARHQGSIPPKPVPRSAGALRTGKDAHGPALTCAGESTWLRFHAGASLTDLVKMPRSCWCLPYGLAPLLELRQSEIAEQQTARLIPHAFPSVKEGWIRYYCCRWRGWRSSGCQREPSSPPRGECRVTGRMHGGGGGAGPGSAALQRRVRCLQASIGEAWHLGPQCCCCPQC